MAGLTAGQVLEERYHLQRCISDRVGRQTWLAVDRLGAQKPQRVVIKFLAFGGQNQWQDLKLFEREVRVLQQLQHPRIPRIQSAFHIKMPAYWVGFVAQYIPGWSLQRYLEQGKTFTEGEVKAIAAQVLKILHYLHSRQPPVLHRDLKPSNLILTRKNQIFLVDFGAVQDRPRPAGQSFTVVGSYGYTPMEQFGGQTVPASDLYALGATLVHLLTGLPPAELLQPDLRLAFGDLVDLSPAFSKWLTRMTAPALAQRFPSAKAALQALQGMPALPSAPDAPFDPQHSRVEIQASPESLMIQVPPLVNLKLLPWVEVGLMTSLMVGLVLVLGSVGVWLVVWGVRSLDFTRVSAGILLLLVGVGIALWGSILLKRNLSASQLELTPQHCQITWKWGGITYWRQRWPLDLCTQVTLIPLSPNDARVDMVQEGGRSHPILQQLTPAEGKWLVDEMQNWLQFSRAP